MTPQVVTVGEAMIAMIAENGLPLPVADRFARCVVGAEANVATGLARLGHSVAYVGRVGADADGDVITRTLRGEGVDVGAIVRDDQRPTGLLVRDAPSGRPLTVTYHRTDSAGSALCVDDVAGLDLHGVRVLHVSGITPMLSDPARAATHDLIGRARAAGAHVTLDPNVRHRLAPVGRWREVLAELVPFADTMLVGDDELAVIGDVDRLLAAGPARAVIKHGAAGATEHGADGTHTVPARVVPSVDPVGAGDACAAGWISGWLDGLGADDRLARAAAVASCVVACVGDTAGLPDRTTVAALLGDGPDVHR